MTQETELARLKNIIAQQKSEIVQLKNIIEDFPGDVYWKNKDGVWLGVNRTGSESLRQMGFVWNPHEIIGKTDYELFEKRTADLFRKNDLQTMQTGVESTNEEINILPSGKKIIQLSTKRPLLDENNQTVGIVGISIDITERKQKEEELREAKEKAEIASKTKTEFLENMRHDIRTPLTGIVGFAELIKNEVTDPKTKEYAANLAASGYALTDLLNGVLEVVKVTSGEVPLLKKKFNLQKKLNEVILLNQAVALHKKIDLSLNYDATIPNYLVGDPARIHRVVLELVTNALNFTHKGYVKLSAHFAKNNDDDVIIKIIVDDTGIGIPPEKQ